MNLLEYQQKSYIAIQPHTDLKDELLNWSIGLSEECGEVMNIIKHHCWGNELIDNENLAKELGDVLWYLSALATVCNLNLNSIAELNYEKLNYRFQGNFSEKKSQQRHENEQKFQDTKIYKNLMHNLFLLKSKDIENDIDN